MPLLTTPALPPGTLAGRPQPDLDAGDLLLRPWHPDDGQAVLAAYADPAIRRWHCRTMSGDEARDWIDAWPRRWHQETDASWAVTDHAGVLGQVGLRAVDLYEGEAAVSYWVLPAARGQRVAARALTALTAFAFDRLGLHRLGLRHSTANGASCQVAQRAGFHLEGTNRGAARHTDGWHDMHVHARLRTDT
ncbi:GNAT family N-acetyltransferase [Micromonospora terminaliae]|uniref:GNAT family N-acetyltransferase n=1 Tax=Micromonospora terminaliae TaxID=1914461 RepID=A0AAJ3DIE4_9ACTN|nr:GNAT family N-acetyltransferase [Micromonospora terminaliae]NES27662.1 GNAT family N-acetyltransferase [Micromonospora terminaliae]QGL47541.1 GNAT family N-acetyltransferase [Micromonospora terminaliae]